MAGSGCVLRLGGGLVALLLVLAQGCSGAPKTRPDIGAGVGLSGLPQGYSIVIGRTCATLDGAPLKCTYVQGDAACGLALAYAGRQTFLIPHQSESRALGLGAEPDPFFVLRLPKGTYQVTHFESSLGSVPPRYNKGLGKVVPIRKRFTVGEKEILYVGSLFLDIPRSDGGRVSVRVEDEADGAREVARKLGGGSEAAFTVRLMGD